LRDTRGMTQKRRKPWVKGEIFMRKRRALPLLLMLLLLSGCGRTESSGQALPAGSAAPQAVQSAPAVSSADLAESSMAAVRTENSMETLSEEEILSAYNRAVTAFGWFAGDPLPCTDDTARVGETLYQRVDYAGFYTAEDLRTYLRSIFSEEIVEKLMPEEETLPLYRDISGALYERPSGRGGNPPAGSVTETVEQVSGTAYDINVAVEMLGEDQKTVTGLECFTFPYQFVNDRWVFTDFTLVN